MHRLPWLRLSLGLALLTLGGGVIWQYAHRGYPDAVYYQMATITVAGGSTAAPVTVARWIDPRRAALRARTPQGVQIIATGREYDPVTPGGQPLTPAEAQSLARICAQLRAGGPGAIGASWLALSGGAATHGRFAGHPALLFATVAGDDPGFDAFVAASGVEQVLAWVDARSMQPLQRQISYVGGGEVIERFVRNERLAPGTLPADFFDPPGRPSSLWERFTGWLRDRVTRTRR